MQRYRIGLAGLDSIEDVHSQKEGEDAMLSLGRSKTCILGDVRCGDGRRSFLYLFYWYDVMLPLGRLKTYIGKFTMEKMQCYRL